MNGKREGAAQLMQYLLAELLVENRNRERRVFVRDARARIKLGRIP